MSDNLPEITNRSDADNEVADENDIIIRKTQGIRMDIVAALTKSGPIPSSEEDRALLMKALDGASGTAIKQKTIKSNEKSAASNEALAAAIAMGATAVMSNMPVIPIGREKLAVIDVDMKIVPGHTYIGTQAVDTQKILADDSL